MQGFNMGRFRPYDSDPSKESFNARSGKHPLGDRARKLDQGVLIVRFELPFNVWCGGCEAHIGQGVRYNAEKRKVGNYYSTPIFAFRCKCHLCSHWFEIRTDPKNTRYVVESGARQQNQEWDAEANGSFSIELDRGEGSNKKAPEDAFEALEKAQTQKQAAKRDADRLVELEEHNERWADPYSLNAKLRKRLRSEKRVEIRQQEADDCVRERIGWHGDLKLQPESEASSAAAREEYKAAKEKLRAADASRALEMPTPSSSSSKAPTASRARSTSKRAPAPSASKGAAQQLADRLFANTREKQDPFLQQVRSVLGKRDR